MFANLYLASTFSITFSMSNTCSLIRLPCIFIRRLISLISILVAFPSRKAFRRFSSRLVNMYVLKFSPSKCRYQSNLYKRDVTITTTCPALARELADAKDKEKVPADEDMSSRGRNRGSSHSGAEKADKARRNGNEEPFIDNN